MATDCDAARVAEPCCWSPLSDAGCRWLEPHRLAGGQFALTWAYIGLDFGGTQAREPVAINVVLPGQKFLGIQPVPGAGFFQR